MLTVVVPNLDVVLTADLPTVFLYTDIVRFGICSV